MHSGAARKRRTLVKNGKSSGMGKRIRALRLKNDLSQIECARAVEVSRSAFTQWESGTTSPNLGQIEALAGILKTSPEFIAFGSNSKEDEDDGTVQVPVLDFSTRSPKVVSHLGLDKLFVDNLGVRKHESLKAFAIVENPHMPGYKRGDRVVFDAASKEISNRTPIALMVQGMPKVAVASVIPSKDAKPKVKVTIAGESHEMPLHKLLVMGTVVAGITQSAS